MHRDTIKGTPEQKLAIISVAETVTKKSYISRFRKLKYTKTWQEKGKDIFVFTSLKYARYGSDLDHSGI